MPESHTTHRFTLAHPTDLSAEGRFAMNHALAVATASDATFYALHVDDGPVEPSRLPRFDETLERWADLGNEDARAARGRLDYVLMNHTCCDDTIDTLLDALDTIEPDVMVVGTHQRDGLARFAKESVSEILASHGGKPTIFVPLMGRGFVNESTGRIEVTRVLVPVEAQSTASRAMLEIHRLLERMGVRDVVYTLVHVGEHDALDTILAPEGIGARVERVRSTGPLVDAIVRVAEHTHADLIAMPTRGHDSLSDWLLGSRTERVVRKSPCPVVVFDL